MTQVAGHLLPSHLALEEELFRSQRSLVLRCRDAEGGGVIVKQPTDEIPSASQLARYRHEFQLLQRLEHRGIPRAYGLHRHKASLALELEDIGGRSLAEHLEEGALSSVLVCRLLERVAQALAHIHAHQIVHKDISPHNIVWDRQRERVQLIDFDLASPLAWEEVREKDAIQLEGNLLYLAPEQTGRMNRGIDFRTDFYALGATAWHLLVGRPPFAGSDPMALLHAHLSRHPTPPHERDPGIFLPLSQIVLKLMAKQPEARYQSAQGLLADLARCEQMLLAGEAQPFALGEQEHPQFFALRDKLYGRERELERLHDGFAKVRRGEHAFVLIGGPTGIGKTSLVRELQKPVAQARGYYCEGRFALLHREEPYRALSAALRALFRQVLAENEEELARWRQRLEGALGRNSGLLTPLVPELEHIIQESHPPPALEPQETRNRFLFVFSRLFREIASENRPIVLFLDDLQWADGASLEVLSFLVREVELAGFFLLGGYRSEEVDATHLLARTIEGIEQDGSPLERILLGALETGDLEQMVEDVCHCAAEDAAPLAALLQKKTAGNPFFLRALLTRLYEDGLLRPAQRGWEWDLGAIARVEASDNVRQFMLQELQHFSQETQHALRVAACLGHRFESQTLAKLCGQEEAALASALWPALQHGSIIPEDEHYKLLQFETRQAGWYHFAHDQIQAAAYGLLSQAAREELHLRIARHLLASENAPAQSDALLEIVGHLQQALGLLEQEEREQFARLACAAGQRAQASAAFETALDLFEAGREALGAKAWTEHHALTRTLALGAAEAAFVARAYDVMEQRLEEVLAQEEDLLACTPAWTLKIRADIHRMRLQEAAQASETFLELAGSHTPRAGHPLLVLWDLLRTRVEMPSPEELLQRKEATDPLAKAIMEVQALSGPAYNYLRPELLPRLLFRDLRFVQRHGPSPECLQAYVGYGLMLAGLFGQVDLGVRYGEAALQRLEQGFDAQGVWPRVAFYLYLLLYPWVRPIAEIEGLLAIVQARALEVGDIPYAVSSHDYSWVLRYIHGQGLQRQHEEIADFLRQRKEDFGLGGDFRAFFLLLQEALQVLCAPTFSSLPPALMPPREPLPDDHANLFGVIVRLQLCMVFGQREEALQLAFYDSELLDHPSSSISCPLFWTYALNALCLAWSRKEATWRQIRKRVKRGQRYLKRWCEHVMPTRAFRLSWTQASLCVGQGHLMDALTLYDRALEEAHEAGFPQDAALIAEHTAALCERLQRPRLARFYRKEALASYQQWGPEAKLQQIREQHPALFPNRPVSSISSSSWLESSRELHRSHLDLDTILKASQALSSELQLDLLLQRLMELAIENAGASDGLLLRQQESTWEIAAQSHTRAPTRDTHTRAPTRGSDASAPAGESHRAFPISLIQYVARTQDVVLLEHPTQQGNFVQDPYIQRVAPKSILCLPLVSQGKLLCIVYLENRLTHAAFTPEDLEVLQLLSTQAAISIENATLYISLEDKVRARTSALREALDNLKTAQAQLVQSEKMAGLGTMVAGVAHELNNPNNFISGGAHIIQHRLEGFRAFLAELLEEEDDEVMELFEEQLSPISRHVESILDGSKRIDTIVKELRTFSRLDEAPLKEVDVIEGLKTTITLVQASFGRQVGFVQDLQEHPPIRCWAAQLNQAFMNIMVNACQAIEARHEAQEDAPRGRLLIRSSQSDEALQLTFEDNGCGMEESTQAKVFEPFFTTKDIGQGAGLGLSSAYGIIKKHKGHITIQSSPLQGTTLQISIPFTHSP